MHLALQTPRLCLRRVTPAHVDDLVALDADPDVMRYINGGEPTTRAQCEADVLPRMLAWDDHPYGFLAAYAEGTAARPGSPGFLGWFHLRPSVADAAILELGYRLRRAAWGRGLATEGARALLEHAFVTLDQPAVDACTRPDNAASIAVMTKCGMRRVGTFVHPRIPIEVVRYLVGREEWRDRSRG